MYKKLLAFFCPLAVGALAFVAASVLGVPPAPVLAQVYPVQTPTYFPQAVLASQTLSAIGSSSTYLVNGVSSVYIRVLGTNSGMVATFQVTESRGVSPTWTTVTAEKVGLGLVGRVTGNGLYRVNTSGAAGLRLNVTALGSGTAILTMAGGVGGSFAASPPAKRSTYAAAVTALAPVASATDLVTLTGSATTTARLNYLECSGISTANATATVNLVKRSAANTLGTSAAMTAVPYDSTAPAATATALSYTANPTLGATVGTVRSGKLATNTAATSTTVTDRLVWTFGSGTGTEVVLRGIAEVIAVNGAGASFTAGTALNCSIEWTEE